MSSFFSYKLRVTWCLPSFIVGHQWSNVRNLLLLKMGKLRLGSPNVDSFLPLFPSSSITVAFPWPRADWICRKQRPLVGLSAHGLWRMGFYIPEDIQELCSGTLLDWCLSFPSDVVDVILFLGHQPFHGNLCIALARVALLALFCTLCPWVDELGNFLSQDFLRQNFLLS